MHAASSLSTPRSTYQAWGGFREPQADAYPVKSMWKGTTLVTNGEGNRECFAIGPDGYVWSYEIGTAEQSAGRLVSTGLAGDAFGLGVTGGGMLVAMATEGNLLRCVMELYDAEQRWSAPLEIAFPAHAEETVVEKVITQTRGDNLFIGFIVCQLADDGTMSRRLWEAVWAGTRPVLAAAPVSLACGQAFWANHLSATDRSAD